MIIYSEKTKEQYNSIKECIAAEAKYDALKVKEAEEKQKLAKEKERRTQELTEAFEEMKEAMEKYSRIKQKYIEDYSTTIAVKPSFFGAFDF